MTTLDSAQKKRLAELQIIKILRELEKDTDCTVEGMFVTTMEGYDRIIVLDSVRITLVIR